MTTSLTPAVDPVHTKFDSITRLNRKTIATEKIHGQNVALCFNPDGTFYAQSRKQIITPQNDVNGFARWVYDNADQLFEQLGYGMSFGEWFGPGVQKGANYNFNEKQFALFNTGRWTSEFNKAVFDGADPDTVEGSTVCIEAPLCHVVPVIAVGESLWDPAVIGAIEKLKAHGSYIGKGFMNPEGVVVFHDPSRTFFKVLIHNDHIPKSMWQT